MSSFWSAWIIALTVLTLVGILWLLLGNRKTTKHGEDQKTSHVFDGIEEYDNPLPAWWMQMFIASIVFAVAYLVVYPGMGSFKGMLGWTQINQYEKEVAQAEEKFLKVYGAFPDQSVEGLAAERKAVKMGQRLFSNNCSVCHGSDAAGTLGYPNLTDNNWLWGGSGEQIKQSITHGRMAAMPAWGAVLGEEKVLQTANYLKAVSEGVVNMGQVTESEQENPALLAGQTTFNMYCVACHGAEAKGNQMMGAPNLTDSVWLYGGSVSAIAESINKGRMGRMPAHAELLSEERIQLISAYVYSLSQ